MSQSGILRFFEADAFGVKTGRQLIILRDAPLPPSAPNTTWRIDAYFNPADELLKTPSFKAVLRSVLKNRHEIIVSSLEGG